MFSSRIFASRSLFLTCAVLLALFTIPASPAFAQCSTDEIWVWDWPQMDCYIMETTPDVITATCVPIMRCVLWVSLVMVPVLISDGQVSEPPNLPGVFDTDVLVPKRPFIEPYTPQGLRV